MLYQSGTRSSAAARTSRFMRRYGTLGSSIFLPASMVAPNLHTQKITSPTFPAEQLDWPKQLLQHASLFIIIL